MVVNSICIAGGGSSGWMLAVALQKHAPNIKVTLVESPKVGNVGVGESTIPYFSYFISTYLGFEEKEWMPYCDAVYKSAIRFQDFKYKGHSLYHPFWNPIEGDMHGFDWSIKNALDPENSTTLEYYYAMYQSTLMCRDNKFSPFDGHAHHMDANKFGEFCKEKCSSINHVIGHISSVELTEDKYIKKLLLEDGSYIENDLFVDCTGFASILLGKTLKEEFVSSNDVLLNDSAIFARMFYTEDSKSEELQPYTDCTALSSGWAWNTPLWSKIGTGYVYSSKFLSKEEAEKEFSEYLSDRYSAERVDIESFNHVKIKAGKHKRAWVSNCASLVLSSGFVEPLESTGLALTASQIEKFVAIVKNNTYNKLDSDTFNHFVNESIDEVVDFVSLHYVSSDRVDSPYWKFINNHVEIPNTLVDKMINPEKRSKFYFPERSWEAILIGFSIYTSEYYNTKHLMYNDIPLDSLSYNEKSDARKETSSYLDSLRKDNEDKVGKMLKHVEYLENELYPKQ